MKVNIAVCIAAGIVVLSCQSKVLTTLKPTYNRGGFALNFYKSKSISKAVIVGQVKDVDTKQTIGFATIKVGCLTIQSDSSGRYAISEKAPSDISFLTCSFIGYRMIETEHFRLSNGDSLKIDFFLAQDDRPIINCEGQEG